MANQWQKRMEKRLDEIEEADSIRAKMIIELQNRLDNLENKGSKVIPVKRSENDSIKRTEKG